MTLKQKNKLINDTDEMTNGELLEFRRKYNKEKEHISQDDRELIEKIMDDREDELRCK